MLCAVDPRTERAQKPTVYFFIDNSMGLYSNCGVQEREDAPLVTSYFQNKSCNRSDGAMKQKETRNKSTVVVTALRERLVYSETIRLIKQSNEISGDLWPQDRVQFGFLSVNDRKWILLRWEWMTSGSVHFINESMRFNLRATKIPASVDWIQNQLSPKPVHDNK